MMTSTHRFSRLMSPSFLVKMFELHMRPFTHFKASSIYVRALRLSDPKVVVYLVKRVVILDYVEHVIESGHFQNLHLFKSIHSLGIIFRK
jgi:hypothetical protein